MLLLGDAQFQQGGLEEARRTYEAYARLQPFLPAVWNNLGRVYAQLGMSDQAEDAYQAGLAVYEGNSVLVNNLAVLYRKTDREEQALELFRRHGAGTAKAQLNLGLILAQRNRFDDALSAYHRAREMDPDLHQVLYSLAGLQMVMGAFDSSAAQFEAFLDVWDGDPTYVRRARGRLLEIYPVTGDRHFKEANWEGAIHAYRRLVELGDASAQLYSNLATLYRKVGDHARALGACNAAIREFPDSPEAYFTRALLLDDAGNRPSALRAYRAFLDRWARDDRLSIHARSRIQELAPLNPFWDGCRGQDSWSLGQQARVYVFRPFGSPRTRSQIAPTRP